MILRSNKNNRLTGDMSEIATMYYFSKYGYKILQPFGAYVYDLVIHNKNIFYKIQIKTGKLSGNKRSFGFPKFKKGKQYDKSDVDLFAVYLPELENLYLIPIHFLYAIEGNIKIGSKEEISCKFENSVYRIFSRPDSENNDYDPASDFQ